MICSKGSVNVWCGLTRGNDLETVACGYICSVRNHVWSFVSINMFIELYLKDLRYTVPKSKCFTRLLLHNSMQIIINEINNKINSVER